MRAEYLTDVVLVDRCLSGEREAASHLFRTYQGRVQATLFRVLGHRRDLEDLLQETFLQVFRSLQSYRGEAKLSTWIDRIAVRVAYKHLARHRAAVLLVELDCDADAHVPGAAEQLLAREGVRRFYAALAELSPGMRIAFVLHAVEGRKVAEVAECLGASVTATKLRIWRARRALAARAAQDAVLAEFLREGSGEEQDQ